MLSVFRGLPSKRIPRYVLAEILGAFTGALLAFAINRDNIIHSFGGLRPDETGIYFYTEPQTWISPASAFFSEFLTTAVLGCAIMALGDSGNSPPGAGMHALIIGLVVMTCTIIGSYSTRACLNPARDFGPRLATMAVGYPTSLFTAYHNWWVWGPWCGTISGALMGGFAYDVCIFRGSESPVNFSLWRFKMEGMKEESQLMRRFQKGGKAAGIDRKIEEGLAHPPESE
jgi:aquaglyceroporin related protein, other eukaryote